MKMNKIIFSSLLIIIALFGAGCLVSGTFVITESFSFMAVSGFYTEAIDLTDNEDWEEHRDNLDAVDVVGFELWITNNSNTEWSFHAFMDDFDNACATQGCADASTTKFLVFDTLTIPASTSTTTSQKYVSYAESFTYIKNLDKLKQLVFDGSFVFYGYSSNIGVSGTVDSVKVIITVNASDT